MKFSIKREKSLVFGSLLERNRVNLRNINKASSYLKIILSYKKNEKKNLFCLF
jgi:hypothetical protein